MSKVAQQEKVNFGLQGRIKECHGSSLNPVNAGLKMIVSFCSQSDKYESPFYNMLIKRFGKVHSDFREWFVMQNLKFGTVNTTAVNSDTWIMSLVCLDKKNKLDKAALEDCLKKVIEMAVYERFSLHISEMLLKEAPHLKKLLPTISNAGVNVYLYKEDAINI